MVPAKETQITDPSPVRAEHAYQMSICQGARGRSTKGSMRSHHNSNFRRTCICHCRSFNVTSPRASDTFAEFNAPLTSCLFANIKIAASASDYIEKTFASVDHYQNRVFSQTYEFLLPRFQPSDATPAWRYVIDRCRYCLRP